MLPPARPRRRVGEATFVDDLERRGTAIALVDGETGAACTYEALAARADELARRIGADRPATRRLVVIEATTTVDTVVAELACLRGGHPVLLVPPGPPAAALVAAYDPDVVVRGASLEHRRAGASAHDLHPDLALLLSTSGSTGAPKLVRLSHENLASNAEAIATSLGLDGAHRAVTSLPLAYCYGLSVLHSHLAAGASMVLTERSVVDEGFWSTFRRHGATSFAGVPHTFDLLDRAGFADLDLPTLRYVTQAGGRLEPATVRRYAELGRRRGFDLVVMYGQTEATARMAYLPPHLAVDHPSCIGIAVPGGDLRLEDADPATGIGELVYSGPNVMLGYATGTADLALGRSAEGHRLRTGDLARRHDGGLFEVVGRRHRFVKPFGLRIDLDRIEGLLREAGVEAWCAGDDRHLVLAVAPPCEAGRAAALVRDHTGLTVGAVHAHGVPALPRLANGKPDHATVLALGPAGPAVPSAGADGTSGRVRRLVATALQLPAGRIDDGATFVSLGGDSLSYVEVAVGLEELLGAVPDDWPTRTIAELEGLVPTGGSSRRLTAPVETSVLLRAGSIVLIVATHAGLVSVRGGAHVLLAVAGWNFARFQLPLEPRRFLASVGRVAVPTVAWLTALWALTDDYGLANLALVHTQLGDVVFDQRWRYWFIEALVQVLLVGGAVLAVPAVRRLEARRPLAVALGALAVTLGFRFAVDTTTNVWRPHEVAWCFALGWAIHRSTTAPAKALVSVAAVVAVEGFFEHRPRELLVLVGLLALTWLPSVRLPRPAQRVAALMAQGSLVVYLTHWQVYPAVRDATSPGLAVVASFAVGLAVHAAVPRLLPRLRESRRRQVTTKRFRSTGSTPTVGRPVG
ncbi:MAG TPA: AMP-binding protein [Acidimicrobiales bacterium]|nr:AMP-binding protein [Acidimicrobiales bacterium]